MAVMNLFGVIDRQLQKRSMATAADQRMERAKASAKLRLCTMLLFAPCVIVGLQEILEELARLIE
jgi:hypothetical protein